MFDIVVPLSSCFFTLLYARFFNVSTFLAVVAGGCLKLTSVQTMLHVTTPTALILLWGIGIGATLIFCLADACTGFVNVF